MPNAHRLTEARISRRLQYMFLCASVRPNSVVVREIALLAQ